MSQVPRRLYLLRRGGSGRAGRNLRFVEPELQRSEFLRAWHARFPGLSSATFSYGSVVGDGRSGYALLVDDVAGLASAQTVVDLACGDGYLLELLAERFPATELIGVDMASAELELAAARGLPGNVRLLAAQAEALLPLADASVDAVVCHMALMLFDDARSVVGEMTRVIRPGGIFAAVLGPGQRGSEFLARFVAMLRELEAAEELPPLRVGDPVTFDKDSLRALFTSDGWSHVRIDDIQLQFDGTDEQIQASLLAMYNIARLSEKGQDELAARLAADLHERRRAEDSIDCRLGLRHLLAHRRPASEAL